MEPHGNQRVKQDIEQNLKNLMQAVKHATSIKCGALTTEEHDSNRDYIIRNYSTTSIYFPVGIRSAPNNKTKYNSYRIVSFCIRKCQTNPSMTYELILETSM